MAKIKDPVEEQLELLNRSPALFAEKMNRLAKAIVERKAGDVEDAMSDLERMIGQTMALADLVGRKRLLMEADAAGRRSRLRFRDTLCVVNFASTPLFPKIPFEEAFEDIIGREPRLAKNADEIRRVYETGGFAVQKLPSRLSNQARLKLTARIQEAIGKFLRKGTPVPKAAEVLAEVGDFSRSYAETVFRTNAATAYTAGRFRQMQDPDVREVVPAFEYDSVGDADTRRLHLNATGLTAPVNHSVWHVWSPPVDFACRCSLRSVDRFELEDRGMLVRGQVRPFFPPSFDARPPNPKFRVQRTDARVYLRSEEAEEQVHPLEVYL